MALKERYIWRHSQIFKKVFTLRRKKIDDFDEADIPVKQLMNVQFVRERRRECSKTLALKLTADDRWNGSWKIM